MFGIGITEIIIILIVALLVVGPKKLPELARTLGRGMAEFRKTADDFKESIYQDDNKVETDLKKAEEQRKTTKIAYPVAPHDPETGDVKEIASEGSAENHDDNRKEESSS
jgi:Tat protein translocase TatB subunit